MEDCQYYGLLYVPLHDMTVKIDTAQCLLEIPSLTVSYCIDQIPITWQSSALAKIHNPDCLTSDSLVMNFIFVIQDSTEEKN